MGKTLTREVPVSRPAVTAYQICTRCVMDTSDYEIVFDDQGVCNHCKRAEERFATETYPADVRPQKLAELVEKVKAEGKGKEYDCIIGVSGGVDSTFVAYQVKQLGLRPLAIHFDNGWNSELAVHNIKEALDALKIDLYTYVVDWEEFRNLQLSFLKASVPNCEIPTDHGINALLMKMSKKHNLRYILSGSNLATEAIMPISWGYYNQDLKHMLAVHKQFGDVPLKTMPKISLANYITGVFVRGVRYVPLLNYLEYNKADAMATIEKELKWRPYGGKHYESVWTRFFQGYYLPTKFGFDKRRAHLSTLVAGGQMTREEALAELEKPAYPADLLVEDMQFVLKKFGLSQKQWDEIMATPPKRHNEYPSNEYFFHRSGNLKAFFKKVATRA